jgi:hypothetical protein
VYCTIHESSNQINHNSPRTNTIFHMKRLAILHRENVYCTVNEKLFVIIYHCRIGDFILCCTVFFSASSHLSAFDIIMRSDSDAERCIVLTSTSHMLFSSLVSHILFSSLVSHMLFSSLVSHMLFSSLAVRTARS